MSKIQLLYIDLFCGAGGTSSGVEFARYKNAKCAKVIACVNHDKNAILSHAAYFARHYVRPWIISLTPKRSKHYGRRYE